MAPEICREAERRLTAHAAENGRTLGDTGAHLDQEIAEVVAGPAGRRLALLTLTGYLTITRPGVEARSFGWQGGAVVAVNPGGRLRPLSLLSGYPGGGELPAMMHARWGANR